jgi:LysM repeat protein
MRRSEAYPTIKARAGLPSLSRVAVLAGAVGIAALALFMLPALLGIGGGAPSGSRDPSRSPAATAPASPTAVPAPTPQVYVIKTGDTLLKVAKKFGLTLDELLAANPKIKDPNKIGLGQEIIIPLPRSDEASPSAARSAPAP